MLIASRCLAVVSCALKLPPELYAFQELLISSPILCAHCSLCYCNYNAIKCDLNQYVMDVKIIKRVVSIKM